ncbi:MAG: CRTAC1 family protein [Cyanobacteria bacterium J06626_6]
MKFFTNYKAIYNTWLLALAALTCAVIIASSTLLSSATEATITLSAEGRTWFAQQSVLMNVAALFDLGVVDMNSDQQLDIYTSNHSEKQFLLLGGGDRTFSDSKISTLGLDQDATFPGLEPEPGFEPDTPGFYIYWQGRKLILERYQADDFGPFKGQISLSSSVEEVDNQGVEIAIEEKPLPSGISASKLTFSAPEGRAQAVLRPYNQSIPITVSLDSQLPLEKVHVGNQKVNPPAHEFTLYLRDRHGMAWADYDDRGMLDVFIVRGGLRARMDRLPEPYFDELLLSHDQTGYEDQIERTGLIKEACPALQTAWVDFNADGLLDIYTVCFAPPTATRSYANQLHQQQPDGRFIEVAQAVGLDIADSGTFAWLDADRDGAVDMLWADSEAFWLYANRDGKFKPQRIGQNSGNTVESFSDSSKLTVADYDNDGDLDVFFASPGGNTLLGNQQGTFDVIEPKQVSLPARSLTANWVDFDNDGLVDLHAMPQGLYRQTAKNTFAQLNLLQSSTTRIKKAFANWFDADNDGARDLLMSTDYQTSWLVNMRRRLPFALLKPARDVQPPSIVLYPNLGTDNHWLEIDLVGSAKNRQAVGALVELETARGIQLQTVGQSDGAHFSQGHYRLYFGLGAQSVAKSIRIYWPSGETQSVENVAADQLLTLSALAPMS